MFFFSLSLVALVWFCVCFGWLWQNLVRAHSAFQPMSCVCVAFGLFFPYQNLFCSNHFISRNKQNLFLYSFILSFILIVSRVSYPSVGCSSVNWLQLILFWSCIVCMYVCVKRYTRYKKGNSNATHSLTACYSVRECADGFLFKFFFYFYLCFRFA